MRTKRILAVVGILALVAGVIGYNVYAASSLTSTIRVDMGSAFSSGADMVLNGIRISTVSTNALANGTGANQADVIFSDTRSVATGATDDLDLNGGGLLDPFGAAFAPVKVKALYIKSNAANTTNLTIGNDALPLPVVSADDTITLQPGGVLLLVWPAAAGIAVGAGATDTLQIVNGAGATATYDIIILGTSA